MTTKPIPLNDPGQFEAEQPSAFLSAGFRPFFLGAGVFGATPIVAWVLVFVGYGDTPGGFAPAYWHGHEMIFGFVAAAMAGFLLTAVPNWTRTGPYQGQALAVLALVWLSGRLVMWFGGSAGPLFVAAVDLLLLPVLAIYIGKRLVVHKVRRNYIVLVVLFVLFAANAAMHLENIGVFADSAGLGLDIGIYGVVFLVTMISGRVIPGFTANVLRRQGIEVDTQTPAKVTLMVVAGMILTFLLDLSGGPAVGVGVMAGLTAFALLARMSNWRTMRILGDPMMWILHAGHLWLVIGFALLAAANFSDGLERNAGLHALTAGAMGTMVLGMMTRVALGHSGRDIKASRAVVLAFVMVISGAMLRVFAAIAGGQLPGDGGSIVIAVAGSLWAGAFAVYVIAFWPILTRPRI